jgi:hypothetical protein
MEEGTYLIQLGPVTDENDEVVTPTAFTWSLSTMAGAIVNSRSDVVVAGASTINILLTGNDLALLSGEGTNGERQVKRLLTYAATYTSDLGAGLILRGEAVFAINLMPIVT